VRVRTDEKRQEIVRAAAELFEEHGFDRASMSMISERVGGSKATLYGYFKSKEELLRAVLIYDISEETDRLMGQFLGSKDLREGLVNMGIAFLTRRLSSMPVANIRMVATQPAGSTVGKEFYHNVLRPAWGRLARRFELMMDDGILRRADPWVAAMHWKGLNEWDMFERRLLGALAGPNPQEVKKAATAAADAFLTIYGANGKKAAKRKVPNRPLQRPAPRLKRS
jgi:AcrR family transcriptional regulator